MNEDLEAAFEEHLLPSQVIQKIERINMIVA